MLVLYLFIPGATAVLFQVQPQSLRDGNCTQFPVARRRFRSPFIGLMLTAAVACYAFEGARAVLTVWLLFCLPGAALFDFQ